MKSGRRKRGAQRACAEKELPALRCVDLFAGAGGFSLAAVQAGLQVVAAVEYDNHACETYRQNIQKLSKQTKLYEGDITELEPAKIVQECFADGSECDLVLGGPPCQGFSVHRLNNSGKNDPRNALIHRYFQFVSALRPKLFLMENVPGLLWPRHAFQLQKFYAEAQAAGYKVMPPVTLDARNFGLPQRRKRVFILGVRNDFSIEKDWFPEPTHARTAEMFAGKRQSLWVDCSDVFRRAPKGDPNNKHMTHSKKLIGVFKKTPPNGGSRKDSGRKLACHEDHDGHKDVYGRIDPRRAAPTMTTACINPSKGRFVHPTQHHGITVRQAARIQTFPDTFIFEGGLMAAGVQIGNAVPVALGKVLLTRVKQLIADGSVLTAQAAKMAAE